MNPLPDRRLVTPALPFTVLIERRARLVLGALLAGAALLLSPGAHGQSMSNKIARDLQQVLAAPTTPAVNFARDLNGVRHVKVLIVANTDDAELAALRSAVMANGGSIYYRYSSVLALAAMLPASRVATIAARSDVQSISPNRLMTRSASQLSAVTGTANVQATGTTNYQQASGYTGKGIGIAVLDSGIAWQHRHFQGESTSESRVREAISFTRAGDAVRAGVTDWKPGIDVSGTLYPGSPSMDAYRARIETGFGGKNDRYGHG